MHDSTFTTSHSRAIAHENRSLRELEILSLGKDAVAKEQIRIKKEYILEVFMH